RSCRPTTRTCDRTRAARLTCYPESAAKHGELARVPDGVLDDTGQEDGKGVVAAGHNLGERVFWEDAQGGFERIAAAGPLREEVVPGYGGLGPFRFRVPGRHRLAGESEAGALIPQQQVLQQRDGGVHAGNRREPGPIGGEIGKDLGKGGAIPATGNGDGVVVGGDALTGGRSRGSHSPTLSRLITCDRVRTLAWGETRGVAPPANIGWAGVGADISHLFFSNPISASIGFEHNPYEFEVGVCDLSLGIVGLMASYYTPAFWLTIIWFASLFKAGRGIGHIRDDLWPWKQAALYNRPDDWVFPSLRLKGAKPMQPRMILKRSFQPAAKRAGINKRIGWHTFRHAYSTLPKANGEDVKAVQELLRHANIKITMDT